jgi:hypothetical protein
METVVDNQVEVLKQEAEDLGIKVHPNAKAETIQSKIDEKKAEIREKQEAKKAGKLDAKTGNKVKLVVNQRDGDDNITEQFFGFNGYTCVIKFDEEVEVPEFMYDYIKSIGGFVPKVKTVTDPDSGLPKKVWDKKWVSRFIVEKL